MDGFTRPRIADTRLRRRKARHEKTRKKGKESKEQAGRTSLDRLYDMTDNGDTTGLALICWINAV